MRRSLAYLVLLCGVLPVSAARAQIRASRAAAAEEQARQTVHETTADGRFGYGRARAVRATALNAIALADDPQRVLALIVPRLEIVKKALRSDGNGFDTTKMGHLITQLQAAARVRELRLAGVGHGRVGRVLGEVSEDGTLSPLGAWRVQRTVSGELAQSRAPRRVLETAEQYLRPLYKTGPWVDERLTTVLARLRAATEVREVSLAEEGPKNDLAVLFAAETSSGRLGLASAARIRQATTAAILGSDDPQAIIALATRYLAPIEKGAFRTSGTRAERLLGELKAAAEAREMTIAKP